MRQRRRGHIINITSMGGFITLPGISLLLWQQICAGRHIRNVKAKSLSRSILHVTAVAPGRFAPTGPGVQWYAARSIPDYDALFEPIRQARMEKAANNPAIRDGCPPY